jgi:hypothetical protein
MQYTDGRRKRHLDCLCGRRDTAGCIFFLFKTGVSYVTRGVGCALTLGSPHNQISPSSRTTEDLPLLSPAAVSTTSTTLLRPFDTPSPTPLLTIITPPTTNRSKCLAFLSILAQLPQLISAPTSLVHYQSGVKLRCAFASEAPRIGAAGSFELRHCNNSNRRIPLS